MVNYLCYIFKQFAVEAKILSITENQVVEAGADVTLYCNVEGVPAPLVTWSRKDGKELADSEAVVTEQSVNFLLEH